jgi:hypothetical protein
MGIILAAKRGFLAAFVVFFCFIALSARASTTNDCLICAAKAQLQLPASTWSRLLIVRYSDKSLQHAYLVYQDEKGDIISYDNVHGTQHYRTGEKNSSALARKIDPRAQWGWYVEDNAENPYLAAN